jgi:hypothetical protein
LAPLAVLLWLEDGKVRPELIPNAGEEPACVDRAATGDVGVHI